MIKEEYVRVLAGIEKSHLLLMCEHCGVETASISETCVCSNCESLAHSTRDALEKRDHMLVDVLDNINKDISEFKYAEALALYDKLVLERKEPSLMYAEALLCTKYSNYEAGMISYDRAGFMDENAQHQERSSKLISASKRLLAKAIHAFQDEMSKGSASPSILYALFLSQTKLGDYKGAQDSLNGLDKAGNSYLANYAAMLFNVNMKKYDDAIKYSERLISFESLSVNALFYIAFSKFKKGRGKEALEILGSLGKFIRSGNVDALINQIKAHDSTWK